MLGVIAVGAIVAAQPPGGGHPVPSDPATKSARSPQAAAGQGGQREITADPDRFCIVNVYSTDEGVDQNFLYNFATAKILPEIKRIRGVGSATIPGKQVYAMRILLNPDRMRAYNLSSEDVMKGLSESSMTGSPGRLGQYPSKTSQPKEYLLTFTGRFNKPEQYGNIILKANPDGEILRIKDVAKVGRGASFYDINSDIDGHPSAAIVLKQTPGSDAVAVIEDVKKKLEQIKKESFPTGMNFEITPLPGVSKDQGTIYAIIQTPPGATLEYTVAKVHDLRAIARDIAGITSVSSLTGYDALTESRASNVGTSLIHWKNGAQRQLTSRQIIEKLEEKGRRISDVKFEFFEPPAVPDPGPAGAIVPATDASPSRGAISSSTGSLPTAGAARSRSPSTRFGTAPTCRG